MTQISLEELTGLLRQHLTIQVSVDNISYTDYGSVSNELNVQVTLYLGINQICTDSASITLP